MIIFNLLYSSYFYLASSNLSRLILTTRGYSSLSANLPEESSRDSNDLTSFSASQLPKTQIQRKHELVATLFKEILGRFRDWDLCQESPSLFLVYAHNNPSVGQADAKVSRDLIQWLSSLRFLLYSDHTISGLNGLAFQTTSVDTAIADDILSGQLCLLPNHPGSVDKVILCGSEVLGRYIKTSYYQSYCQSLQSAYQETSKRFNGFDSIEAAIREVVNHNLKEKEFHHVLTEMAFLHIRYEYKIKDHGIIPVLLNGTSQQCFPAFITNSTTILIEDSTRRVPGIWNGEETYQDQGLHIGFFKLLKRLLVNQERRIQVIEEEVYHPCIQALRNNCSEVLEPQAFSVYVKDALLKALDKLLDDRGFTLRQFDPQRKRNGMSQTAQTLETMQAQTQIHSLIEAKVNALETRLNNLESRYSKLESSLSTLTSTINSLAQINVNTSIKELTQRGSEREKIMQHNLQKMKKNE